MARPASVTKSDLDRAIQCALSAGLRIVEVVVEPRGVRLITDVAIPTKPEDSHGPKDWPSG